MRRILAILTVAALAVGLGGCGSRAVASTPLPTCGDPLPPALSTNSAVRVHVLAPKSAASGSELEVRVRFTSDKPTVVGGPYHHIRIVRHGRVVGTYVGPVTNELKRVTVGPDNPATVRRSLQLLGCPTGKIDDDDPNGSRPRLPAGRYGLVAVIVLLPNGKERHTEPEHIQVTS